MKDKIVLAYSGGVDTSVAIPWLKDKYKMDIVAFSVNMGAVKDLPSIKQKALNVGAIKCYIADAREEFIRDYAFPALRADALYEGQYPLATALGRPLIVSMMVDIARKEKAVAVAHGSTGKGNDQIRFDVGIMALAPDLKIIAPARDWGMGREATIAYANKHNIPIPVSKKLPYSIDENLWGRSCELGVLEDPWIEPPDDSFSWTKRPDQTPDEPTYVDIGFEQGSPVSLNGRRTAGIALVERLNKVGGENGVGRIDHIESRVVGIKSRETYEAPAAVILIKAHLALEAMTMTRSELRFKERVATEYADLVYNGFWFSSYRDSLDAYVNASQKYCSGVVRVKLFKGNCIVVGRKSPYSLYSHKLATYDKGDIFNQADAPPFIRLWGLPIKVQGENQLRKK
jgi:argininosuccinate synthase